MVRADMEGAIKTVVTVFLKSAKGKENLGAKDFQNLVKNQLKNILTGTENSDAVKNMRQGLDSNQDGKVNFQEYMTLVGYLAQSLSQQSCKENQVANSGPETQAEAPEAPKAEAEAEKEAKPVKEEEPVKEQDEAVEVVELVEEEENAEEEVIEVAERT